MATYPISMGILDDYLNIGPAHFAHILPRLSLTISDDALIPYNHPCTTPEPRQAIIARLNHLTSSPPYANTPSSPHHYCGNFPSANYAAQQNTLRDVRSHRRPRSWHNCSCGASQLGIPDANHLLERESDQEKAEWKAQETGLNAHQPDGSRTFRAVGTGELFGEVDVVSLHYVLNERWRGIVGEQELRRMKKSALLTGPIEGASSDVFDLEPLPADGLWPSMDWGLAGRSRLLLTPHMGYLGEGIMHTLYEETAKNLERWLDGQRFYIN
ncbi:D-3-phosphoglycerate dehydrogenase [Penicillium sp. IBT 35674x]|nr:D-3-phosphoglycerate dehydrogenase [Penicillium sp. IBT 35674x]